MDKHIQPIDPIHRGQPKVGHDEPLPTRHTIRVCVGHSGAQGINTRRLTCDGRIQGQTGGDILVHIGPDRGRARPKLGGQFAFKLLFLIGIHRLVEILVLQGAQQVAIGDFPDFKVQRGRVHRHHGNRGRPHAGQNIAPSGEMHTGRAVADIGRDGDLFAQDLSGRGGQALAEDQLMARAEIDAFDTQLSGALERDRHPRLRQFDETRIINTGCHQVFREADADTRAGGLGLHIGVKHAKAVFAGGIGQQGGGVVTLDQTLRQAQGLHHIAATVEHLKHLTHLHQNRMLKRRIIRAQIGVHRGMVGIIPPNGRIALVAIGGQQQKPRIF